MAVTCGVCAWPHEVWPESGCTHCGGGEPAPEPVPSPDGAGGAVEPVPDLAGWTVAALRAECERRGLSTAGTKAALVARLAGR